MRLTKKIACKALVKSKYKHEPLEAYKMNKSNMLRRWSEDDYIIKILQPSDELVRRHRFALITGFEY